MPVNFVLKSSRLIDITSELASNFLNLAADLLLYDDGGDKTKSPSEGLKYFLLALSVLQYGLNVVVASTGVMFPVDKL